LIYGCGHFDGDSYIQNEKEYSVAELKTIETMKGTIQNVRASSKLDNALEFYAHQGKMILRNCDDGYDRNNGARSNAYGMSVTIDPTGMQFRDGNDKIIGELYADDLKKESETIIYVKFQEPVNANTDGYFYIDEWETSSNDLNKRWNNMTPKQRFDDIFVVPYANTVDKNSYQECDFNYNQKWFTEAQITEVNKAFFDNQNSKKITIVFETFNKIKYNLQSNYSNVYMALKLYPYYTAASKANRYMGKSANSIEIFYYTATGGGQRGQLSKIHIRRDLNFLYNSSSLICTGNMPELSQGMNAGIEEDAILVNEAISYKCFSTNKQIKPWCEV